MWKEIGIMFIGSILTGIGFLIQQHILHKSEKEKLIFEYKRSLYDEIFSVLFDIVKSEKDKSIKIENLSNRMYENKKKLIIYTSDRIVRMFLDLSNKANIKSNKYIVFSDYLYLLIEIRKDINSDNSEITHDELLRSFMSSEDDFLKFKNAIDNSRSISIANNENI